MRSRHLIPLAALPLVIMTAAPASAAVTTYYATFQYQAIGDDAEDNLTVTCDGTKVLPDAGPDAPCATLKSLYLQPGNGADTVNLSGVTRAAFPALKSIQINADSDATPEIVIGGPLGEDIEVSSQDAVFAGGGNDVIRGGDRVEGGEGNDTFIEQNAEQGLSGGPGDDRFVDSLSPGGTDGGSGDDTMYLDFNTLNADVALDLTFTASHIKAQTSGGPVDFSLTGVEHVALDLHEAEEQRVDLSAFPGDAVVRGFDGPDIITGTGKSDLLHGGLGVDTIVSRDGVIDIVDCGGDADTATVDAIDLVTNCETVNLPDTSAISGPSKVKKGKKAKFTFSGTVAGTTFECAVDKKPFKPCSSPYTVKTKKLALGKHTLQVKAAGDPTPSVKKFKVKKP